MNLSDLRKSKFLKKEDVDSPKLATITAITMENCAMEGADPDLRPCLHFDNIEKPLVLNSTNGQIIAKITGADTDIENTWIGKAVVLYNDPNVTYNGKLTGGIRVRAPKPGSVPVQKPVQLPEDSGLPF